MGLQLILGGSGSGKTTYMYEKLIKKSGKILRKESYLAVVPEQFTMETQKNIVSLSPGNGTTNIDILSFDRLAKRIFDEAGRNPLKVLDDTGKCLIIRKIADENKEKLRMFLKKIKMPGFIDEMKSLISEFYQYGIGINELQNIYENLNGNNILKEKINDVLIIMRELEAYIKDRYVINEELLQKVCELIPDSEFVKNSYITFDEYTGFTPVQYKVIESLLRAGAEVNVALTIREPEKNMGGNLDTNIFSIAVKTAQKLKKTAENAGAIIYPDVILQENRRQNGELKYLENNIFKFGAKKKYWENIEKISIHHCSNKSNETDFVAAEILRLVREENYRFRDIAVVTGDIENYHNIVREKLDLYGIPYFIDNKTSLIKNPAIEAIRAAFEIISDNFSYESVFRYLRSGMTDVKMEDTDFLENYVLSRGIRGYKKYSEQFSVNDDVLNSAREAFFDEISILYDTMGRGKKFSLKEGVIKVYEFLVKLNAEEKLNELSRNFEEGGLLTRAREYSQVYGKIIELLDKIVFIMGDEQVKIKDFSNMLDSGFEEIKVGVIPASLDRVVVGDIERTRLNEVKVLFLIGANDGIIPKKESKGGIINNSERRFLADSNVELSPTERESIFNQKYYLYLVLSKMSDRLYVSYVMNGDDGKALRKSFIVSHIQKMYENISMVNETINTRAVIARNIATEDKVRKYIAENIYLYLNGDLDEQEKNQFRALYSMCVRGNIDISDLIEAAVYEAKPSKLSKAVTNAIYGQNLQNSVSRLEMFASCAYRHFVEYGLCLQPRREFEVNKIDVGNIYHKAIELFFKKVKSNKLSWKDLDDDIRDKMIKECVSLAVNEKGTDAIFDNSRSSYMVNRIEKIAEKTAMVIQKQIMAGEFVPTEFENYFSTEKNIESLKFYYDDGSQMGLRGVIDRIDYFDAGDDLYVKIIDYKSGHKQVNINDVYNGLQLQLVLYMEAALELTKKKYPEKNVRPAGFFYYNIDNPIIKEDELSVSAAGGDMLNAAMNETFKKLKQDGYFVGNDNVMEALQSRESDVPVVPLSFTKDGKLTSGSKAVTADDMDMLIGFVHNKSGELGEKIISGEIEKNPYITEGVMGGINEKVTPCMYCDFNNICGFDKKIKGYDYRVLVNQKEVEVWEKIRREVYENEKMDGESAKGN